MLEALPESLVEILLVEDSQTDILMMREALEYNKILNPLRVVEDGERALEYLQRQGEFATARLPGLILLDLNLPRMSGRELLAKIKTHPVLSRIPVVVLTTSQAEEDIVKSYGLHANCYISKPVEFEKFAEVVRVVKDFWFGVVKLPPMPA